MKVAGYERTVSGGIPASFDNYRVIVAAGEQIAKLGVHGKPVEFQMVKL